MGKARRKKRLHGQQPPDLGKRLAMAWREADGAEDFSDVFDLALAHQRPPGVFERAASYLEDDEIIEFSCDLFREAETFLVGLRLPDGREVAGELRVFAIPAQGIESHIDDLVSGDRFSDFTNLVRKSGYVHQAGDVLLSPVTIDLAGSMNMTPDILRKIGRAFVDGFTKRDIDAPRRAIRKLLPSPLRAQDDAETARLVTRIILGARLLVQDNENERVFDALGVPDFVEDEEENDEIYLEYEADRLEAMASFMELSCELMETMDWNVIFDGPDAWTGSLGRACLMRVRSHLNIEAGMAGVELDDRCEGHFCVDEKEGVFAIALRHGDSWYGPAEAPGLFASYGMDEITEWMAEACKCGLIEHPDAKSLQALVRAYRHHYN